MSKARILSNSKIVVRELMAEPDPLPLVSACAVAGNGWQENLMEPVTKGRKDHGSDGLLQWRLDRLVALKQLKDWDTLPVQCQFFKAECKVQYPRLWAQLVEPKGRTLANLTANICDVYERPSRAGRELEARISYAEQVYAANKLAVPEVLAPVVEAPFSTLLGLATWAAAWWHVGQDWMLWALVGFVLIFLIRNPAVIVPEATAPEYPKETDMDPNILLTVLSVLEKLAPLIEKVIVDIPNMQHEIEAIKSALATGTVDPNAKARLDQLVAKLDSLNGV